MSPRDTYWFVAGSAAGLTVGALGVYLLVSPPRSDTAATAAANPAGVANTSDLMMPGDQWPSVADAAAASGDSGAGAASAGSLDEVTGSLAQRLATKGGTDDEWRLLAQSYDYMGRKDEARAARMHEAHQDPEAVQGSRISGTVQIAPNLAASAAAGTTLFIYATDSATPGPPLAVLRLRVERWPVSFVLDDADAMIPGRNLSASRRIGLEARISPSGEALPRPGDLVGNLADIDPRTKQAINISINHKIG
jgi:cytochrome c-type biogenesis protein CcmH